MSLFGIQHPFMEPHFHMTLLLSCALYYGVEYSDHGVDVQSVQLASLSLSSSFGLACLGLACRARMPGGGMGSPGEGGWQG